MRDHLTDTDLRTAAVTDLFYLINQIIMRMTKKDVVEQFRWDWSDFLKSNPNFRGDSIAKRCAFNDYVDSLNKDGLVTDYQAYNWSNPF